MTRTGEGIHLNNLGALYLRMGDAHKAIEFHEKALQRFVEIDDKTREGNVLLNLGFSYAQLGDIWRALISNMGTDYYT